MLFHGIQHYPPRKAAEYIGGVVAPERCALGRYRLIFPMDNFAGKANGPNISTGCVS